MPSGSPDDVRHWGMEIELLSANALRARFPFVATYAVPGAFAPQGGHANPRLAAPAFARAARRAGAEVHESTEVLGIAKGTEDFLVETKSGTFRAPALQFSAGAWGRAMAAAFDEDGRHSRGQPDGLRLRPERVAGELSAAP